VDRFSQAASKVKRKQIKSQIWQSSAEMGDKKLRG